jgi:hypothetical protein
MKTMMAVAAFPLASGANAEPINKMIVAPFDKSDMSSVLDMYNSRDLEALAQLCVDGKALLTLRRLPPVTTLGL